jgi:DNA invertase Pin-like site-specific DNA recombinase
MDSSMQRVALYTRISTDETNQPYSLGAQHDRLLAHVSSQPGWQVVAEYEDRASGKSLERPALADARRAATAGAYDLLLVFRVDRLSRNLGQLAALIEELEAAGVAFRSLTEPFDTSNPAGRMMLQMLGVFAEFERASIIERISAGMQRKASRGEWTVGSYPYGYRRGAAGPGLEPDPAAVQIVGDMFERYVTDRLGSGAIAEWLNERGLRTTRGQPWTRASVLGRARQPGVSGRGPLPWRVACRSASSHRGGGAVRGGPALAGWPCARPVPAAKQPEPLPAEWAAPGVRPLSQPVGGHRCPQPLPPLRLLHLRHALAAWSGGL